MKFEEAVKLRDEALADIYSHIADNEPAVRATSADIPSSAKKRMSIGVQFSGKDEYRLAIRVQRSDGLARKKANELMERLKDGDYDFGVIQKVSAPPIKTLATSGGNGCGRFPGMHQRRPLDIGYSIGNLNGPPGTLGLIAVSDEGETVGISNNHIVARSNRGQRGEEIFQMGLPDGEANERNQVGLLDEYVKLKQVGSNKVDAASFVIAEGIEHNENAIPDFGSPEAGQKLSSILSIRDSIEVLNAVLSLKGDAKVAKNGRTSGYTSSTVIDRVSFGVDDVIADIPIIGNCRFDNCIEILSETGDDKFQRTGDSGSVIYVEGERHPFGLMFAAGDVERDGKLFHASYACPLHDVFRTLKLEALT